LSQALDHRSEHRPGDGAELRGPDRQHRTFSSSPKLCSYLGLVPREYSYITKMGDSRMRCLLVECAWGLLRRQQPSTQVLQEWALCIAARRGKRIAVVALARRLATILFAMTQHGREFEPERLERSSKLASAA
jgi:transposase